MEVIKPLAIECHIDLSKLAPQIAVAKNMLSTASHHSATTTEEFLVILSSMQAAFPDLYNLISASVTIPVTSATAEQSFSTLNRVKSYLRSTMAEDRLNNISILSIESELSRNIDYDKVIDKFSLMNQRRLTLM